MAKRETEYGTACIYLPKHGLLIYPWTSIIKPSRAVRHGSYTLKAIRGMAVSSMPIEIHTSTQVATCVKLCATMTTPLRPPATNAESSSSQDAAGAAAILDQTSARATNVSKTFIR